MMYCIGIGGLDNPRYINVCDEFGYNTTSNKLYQFKQSEVNDIIINLKNRFAKGIFVLDQEDNVIYNSDAPKQKKVIETSETQGLTVTIRM